MFQLDDNFLKDLGLDNLPDEQKKAFLQHIYEELELRVGTRLADGLSDEQLGEFEKLLPEAGEDGVPAYDADFAHEWLSANVQDYASRPDYQAVHEQAIGQNIDPAAVLCEYAATKWLEINRPDYRDVVADVLGELKEEISSNRDDILS